MNRLIVLALFVTIAVLTVNGQKGSQGGHGSEGGDSGRGGSSEEGGRGGGGGGSREEGGRGGAGHHSRPGGRGRSRNRCPSEVTDDDKGLIQWPSRKPGERVSRPCPFDRRQADGDDSEESEYQTMNLTMVFRVCVNGSDGAGPRWQNPDTAECLPEERVGRRNRLRHLRNTLIPPGQQKKVARKFNNMTNEARNFRKEELLDAVGILANIISSGENGTDRDTLREVVESMEKMKRVDPKVLKESEKTDKIASKMLQYYDTLASTVELTNETVTITTPGGNMTMVISPLTADNTEGISFAASTGEVSSDRETRSIKKKCGAKLPRSVLALGDRAVFTLQSHEYFQAIDEKTPKGGCKIGVKIGDRPVKDLTDKVNITFDRREMTGDVACAFFDFERNAWSGEGVTKIAEDGDEITCSSDHLTNFALVEEGALSGTDHVTGFSGSVFGLLVSMALWYLI